MNPRFELLEQRVNHCRITVPITAELDCFDGHFERAAIVPGVAQINWVMDCAERFLARPKADFLALEQARFAQLLQSLQRST